MDTLYIKTFGCQMNEYDSSRMVEVMREAYGLRLVANPEDADVILMNTCSVREKAEEKVYSELGRFQQLKVDKPDLIIGVGGCVAQQEGERIQQRAPYVDVVFGPQTYHRLPEMVKDIRRDRLRMAVLDMPEIEKFDHLPKPTAQGVSAFVTIMEGCDKFCSFCIVPYTRGREYSRPVTDVLRECRQLLEQGVVEITLLGQNVNAYRSTGPDGETCDFARLLHEVARLQGLQRLRFTTSHPMEMTDGLVQAFADIPCLMPYLHLPVQSGSDRVLKKMRRRHTRADYLRIIASLRAACPDIALSSDFIVGFPGETDADFAETMELVRQVRFDSSFAFKYSPRPGTPATKYPDDVPEAVKDVRLQALLVLLRQQTRDALAAQVGNTVMALVERPSRTPGDMQARTPDFKIAHFQSDSVQLGRLVTLRITAAYGQSLRGSLQLGQ
ncbi:MAG: tRNA (N6-isopentenyl adenosine(37)-C2)-methylthiotransferase MiaB [Mariprofundaceae bacterium]